MKSVRIAIASALVLAMSGGVPAMAGDLQDSVAAAAAAKSSTQETGMKSGIGSGKAMTWAGGALFATGMTYGLFQFINNKNGGYAEFGEAAATNKKAGAAGLSMAFAGGALMLLGHHAGRMPSVAVGAKSLGLAKRVSW